jgi:DNA-directed RNA polymerase subunit K/omega
MTFLSDEISRFEFVRLAALRAGQLMRGSSPRVPAALKLTTTALREVAGGKVWGNPREPVVIPLVVAPRRA